MNKKNYLIPTLEVEKYAVEQGFTVSSTEGGFGLGDGSDFTEDNVNW